MSDAVSTGSSVDDYSVESRSRSPTQQMSKYGYEDGNSLSHQQININVCSNQIADADCANVTMVVGNVNNINLISYEDHDNGSAQQCETRLEDIVQSLVEPNLLNNTEDTFLVFNNHGKNPTPNLGILGIQTKWYNLLLGLVALSGTVCIVSAISFSMEYFWSSSEIPNQQSSETNDTYIGQNEDYTILHKNWWYLLVALVTLSSINLLSTAMFSFNKYKKSFESVDTVPREFLQEAPRMVNRLTWLAQPPCGRLDPNPLPVERVIVCHTATEEEYTVARCCYLIRSIQMNHIEARKWLDIGYNFLIGGDGSVYVGRGWDWVGSHTKEHNIGTLGIAIIGTFTNNPPNDHQLMALKKLLNLGVMMKKISEEYSLVTRCQLRHTWSPEKGLKEALSRFPHFKKEISTGHVISYYSSYSRQHC